MKNSLCSSVKKSWEQANNNTELDVTSILLCFFISQESPRKYKQNSFIQLATFEYIQYPSAYKICNES